MEPHIQYAKTSDGVSIAYWTLGEGMPLVSMPPVPFSHIQAEWQDPEFRAWYQRLAERRSLVRYDGRGTGLSQRDAIDFSLDAQVRDLEAVVDRLDLDNFTLFAAFYAGPVAIAYAVRQPERISHLILWHSFARASDYLQSTQTRGLLALQEGNWELFTETLAHARLGWSSGERARRWAALIRESVTPEAFRAGWATFREYDVADLLPQVRSPTLVLQRRGFLPSSGVVVSPMDIPRGLASRIPNARLALVEGETGAPHTGDVDAVIRAIDEFLGDGAPASSVESPGATAQPLSEPLSAREIEVLRLIDCGMSNQQIADELFVALGTVKTHINNIYGKLEVRSRTQALARARQLNLLV